MKMGKLDKVETMKMGMLNKDNLETMKMGKLEGNINIDLLKLIKKDKL